MKLIILAAGDSFELHGFNKLLINHPVNKKSIIETYIEVFNIDKIQIVVGYKAMDLMNIYPQFEYIYNKNWQTSGSSFSLSMALDNEPSYVVSSDFFIDNKTINNLSSIENGAVIIEEENKRLSSLKVTVKNDIIVDVFSGKSIQNNQELIGIYKITNTDILNKWKVNCVKNPNAPAGLNLPYKNFNINYISVKRKSVFEINTPQDYINFIKLNNAK